jgi:hypothetical protein
MWYNLIVNSLRFCHWISLRDPFEIACSAPAACYESFSAPAGDRTQYRGMYAGRCAVTRIGITTMQSRRHGNTKTKKLMFHRTACRADLITAQLAFGRVSHEIYMMLCTHAALICSHPIREGDDTLLDREGALRQCQSIESFEGIP